MTISNFILRRPAEPQKFHIDFLPGENRLIRRDGIQLFSIDNWDSTLSTIAGRSKDVSFAMILVIFCMSSSRNERVESTLRSLVVLK